MEQKYSVAKVFNYAGALIAFLIGSAFASGQEVMQFSAAYGFWGAIGSALLIGVLMIFLSVVIMRDANMLKLKRPADLLKYYCGKHVGIAIEVVAFAYLYALFVVMVSGGGAVLQQHFGLDKWIGSTIVTVLALGIVMLGLKGIVDVLGKIGPIKIVTVIAICSIAVFKYHGDFAASDAFLASHDVLKAAGSWWVAGILYPAECTIFMVTFLAAMGASASSTKEAMHGGLLGSVFFSIGMLVVSLGVVATIPSVYSLQAPSIGIADLVYPGLGSLYTIIVFICLLTTSIPCLWVPIASLTTDEKSAKFRSLAVAGAIIALFGGAIDFSKLINIIFPIAGYVGLIVPVSIVIRTLGIRIPGYNTRYNTGSDFEPKLA
jgi:uncharacterized membrane protein YkvI